jgi:hypothetical protein
MPTDLTHTAGRKARYRALCAVERSIPLFSRDWWLDALCGFDGWDVALAEIKNEIAGALPYRTRRILGQMQIGQPPLSAALGPWIKPRTMKPTQRYSHEKDVMIALLDTLPRFGAYRQTWHPRIANWLPFYWHGFTQTTLYTYILETSRDEQQLWSGLRENIRTDIRKARDRLGVKVRRDLTVDDFLELSQKTFARQGLSPPYSPDLVRKLDAACVMQDCRAILIGEDAEGRRHAGAYIVWDNDTAYYLIGGGDPALRNSGAASLCLWEAIQLAAEKNLRFDFEGSMIEAVERHFRAFGGTLTPYFLVEKIPSILLRFALALRKLKLRT